ncbi:ketoacyl-ACP synthase III [Paenibacillus psychroresistens]|uniref:Ketoacyl-ACP synthase III n=1 Tax=Paenibacillus psychroresistens TaxID=1778678 RepID=A0A6B8RT33_9BACL|nr:ketoacyl-ACP synthase III [Paenibacillus psychroresistens]QGQ98476.1 ketoacyl-ACP synthase III [Paenibacillus psychroresistens]
MTIANVYNSRIVGIACAVPNNELDIAQFGNRFTEKEIKKISNMVGVKKLFRVNEEQTTADLCIAAAEKILDDLNWERDSIDGIVFVTQTPDYILPATSCSIQKKLGLSDHCLAFDVSLGCSGYVYGLLIASQFIQSKACKRMLLLVGDTISKVISPEDRSVALLFGDAGSATALEFSEVEQKMTFVVGTDGHGEQNLIIPAGGFRTRKGSETNVKVKNDDGNIRSQEDLYMNGSEIFNFTQERVPRLIKETLDSSSMIEAEVDYYVLHQANKFMLDYIVKKTGIDKDKLPTNIEKYGNTSSASIPLVLVGCLKDELLNKPLNLCLAGFGVGYSWAGATINSNKIFCSEIVYC